MTAEADIKTIVREKYAGIAQASTSCCGPKNGCCSDGSIDMIGDAYKDIEGYVADADLGLGCGLPTRHAGIRQGDTVLDLGSGAGNDVFIAWREVGQDGRVLGVDMTPEMIAKARTNAEKLGYGNVEFRLGEIEALPVEKNSVDVVISNCVLNLVPDKTKAFAEIFRVLKPGAHFCVSDIVATGELPKAIRDAAALYVGCVAGALPEDRYLAIIADAGFGHVRVAERKRIALPDAALAEHMDASKIEAFRTSGIELHSVTVIGIKPSDHRSCC